MCDYNKENQNMIWAFLESEVHLIGNETVSRMVYLSTPCQCDKLCRINHKLPVFFFLSQTRRSQRRIYRHLCKETV